MARLLHKGPDAFLKKIGEEATEIVMAAKDVDHGGDAQQAGGRSGRPVVSLLIALAHYGLTPQTCSTNWRGAKAPAASRKKPCARCSAREAERMPVHWSQDHDRGCIERDRQPRSSSLKTVGDQLRDARAVHRRVLPGAQASVVAVMVALIINYIKRGDAEGPLAWPPHLHDPLLLVGGCCGWCVTSPLLLLFFFPGAIAWAVVSLWYLYRCIRGWMRLNANRPLTGAEQSSHMTVTTTRNCMFCKIVDGKIPVHKVYEDDEIFAFHDIHPWAPVHFLLIPKATSRRMAHVGAEHAALLGRMMALAPSWPGRRAASRIRKVAFGS